MRLRIERTPAAKRDVFALWDYISPESVQGAERLLRRIDSVVHMLAENPGAGRAWNFMSGMRYFPMENYIVFYRTTETTLLVIRILHAAREITPDLLSE